MRLYLKDYVTLCSGASGMAAIFLVVEGQVAWGSFFVWLAWVFDGLDGVVARLTGRKNKIGSHLDVTVDLLGCAIAPAVCVYGGYQPILGAWWAGALASMPVLFGIVRHARSYANPVEVGNLWVGLPRSYSGLGMAGLVGSHLFVYPWFQAFGIAFVLITPALGITTIGWQGRHHAGLKWHQAMFMLMTFATFLFGLVMLALGYGLAWFHDGMLFWMFGYIVLACSILIPEEERRKHRRYIQEWKKGFD
jgi:CDP-diacylglycerol--serine O-phosphatidyltransferase